MLIELNKVQYILLVYIPNNRKDRCLLLYSLAILIRYSYHSSFLTCRTINTHVCIKLSMASLIQYYRKISELQNSSRILRLFVVHSALLLSSVYSARILEEFHLIRYINLSPTISCLSHTLRQKVVMYLY